MKRFLASLLAVLMLVSLLPLSAFAAETKAATVADAQEPAQIVNQQLVLGDNLNMRFWVKANMENAAINVTIGSGATKSIALTEKDANGNYVINVALAAAQMTDVITLQAKAGDVTGTAKQYTVRQYAEVIMEGGYSEPTTNLVQAMLNYGAGAQVYFDYNNTADQLANKGYESDAVVVLPEELAVVTEGVTEGVRFYGASLSFRDRIALRYYFTGDISGMTVNAGEKAYTVGQKDGLSYVELADINPQDYATVYTVSIGEGENPLSVGYSAMHYISRMGTRGSENLVNLLKALLAYHGAANSYLEWLANCDNLADFTVVYGDDATDNEKVARDMIVEYIQKSTGVQLPIIPASEATYTADAKYLVVGNTGLADMAPACDLGYRGYQIQSKDNSVFVCGGTDFGTLCGAVGFLEEVVGLDAYGPQTVNYNKQNEILIDNFDLTVVPDIGMEQPPFMLVSGSMRNQALWGVGQKTFGRIEGSENHWHNSFDYLPPAENFLTNADYYVWSGIKPVQLSYVANGNATAFEAMTTACANKIISAATNNPDMETITLTQQDNNQWDTCDAAMALYNKYGTHSAEVIIFMNAVADKVKAGLPEGRELDIYFFAYVNTYDAPVKLVDGQYVAIDSNVEMRDNLGVMYAPISGDYTADDFSATTMYQQLSGWAALTDNIAVWSYETNFDNYFNFYNSFNILPSMYHAEAEMGVDYSYSQGQWNNGNATGFSHLKTYLIGKLSWNADADFESLLDNYFAARFGSAAEEMRTLFDSMRAYYDELQTTYGISGAHSQSEEFLRTDRFEKAEIEKWLGYLDAAYAKADNDTVRSYIDLESLAVRYLMVELYSDTMAINDLMVMIHTFREDCEALNITKLSESKDIDYLWQQWDDSTVTEIEGISYNFDLSLELSSYEMAIPAPVGTVIGVYGSGYDKLDTGVTIGANSITFTQEAVDTIRGGSSYGDYVLYLSTADTIYKVNVAVVTRMIDSYDDLVAIKANQVDGVLDGYYALANDIDATGEDAICLIEFADHINNLENSGVGFKGIFDGRGYTISNLTVKAGEYAMVGGLFGQILKDAIVRDVAFMDMTTDGATNHTYLLTGESCRMIGTIENVVVSAKGTVRRAFGFVGCDVSKTADAARGTMRNVIISGVDQLAYQIMNMPTIENVVVVANKNLVEAQSSNVEDQEICANLPWYNSNDALFAALNDENVVAQWTDSDITYENTAIKFNGKAIITEQMSIAETEAVIGTTTDLTVQGSVNLSLKDAIDGVSLVGKTLNVTSSVKEGTKVTVVATSTVSGANKEFVITLRRIYTDEALGRLDVEIGADSASMAVADLNGNAECLRYGNTTVYEGYTVADGALSISKELLDAMYARLGVGEHTVYLGTDASVRYAITLTFATKIIENLDDLKSIAVSGNTLDGYYILANNITCTDETFKLVGTWSNTTTTGFVGTFDGRGHVIDGYNGDVTGLFYCMGATAVVKNVAFTNVSGTNVLAGNEVHGATFENIFASGSAKYLTAKAWDSPSFKNIVFVSGDAATGRIFLEGDKGTLTATNVLLVGQKLCYWGGTQNETNVKAVVDTTALLTAIGAEGELDNWTDSSFSYEDGKLFFDGQLVLQYNNDLQGESFIYRGTEQLYMTSDSDLFLKEEIDGVSLELTDYDDVYDIYTLSVDYSVPEGTQIVIVAQSWDYESITKELVVTVRKQYTHEDMTAEGSLADLSLAEDTSSVEVPFRVVGISYGNSEVTTEGVSYADGKATITKAALQAMAAEIGLGEKTVYLYTDNDYCYAVKVTVVTKVLKTQADLQSISIDGTLNGYFVLGNDIVCDGTTPIILAGYTSTTTGGFIGTFDGRGHTISNVYVGTQGFFRGIGAGTVKNVAFVNIISDNVNRSLANETHGCTFENVFVSSNAKYMLQTSWDSPTFKNVVFISNDSAAGRVFNEGGRGTVTATNVFMVGQKLCYFNGSSSETNVKAFASADDLLAAMDTENWVDSFFSVEDGKLLFNEKPVYQAALTLTGAEVLIRGTSESYTSNGIITLKETVDGVSVENGVLSVAYTVPVDTIITLVATHPVYASITTELQVQVGMIYEEIDLTGLGSIGDLETADSYSFIELPEEIDGNITGISYGEMQKYTNISVSDGELAIPKAWVSEIYSVYGYTEQSIKLYTDMDKSYTVTVAIVTKAISNQADLQSIANTADNTALDGYYVLTDDIGCDGTTEIILSCYTASVDKGFIGTFDGRGHTISNVYVGTQGLFRGIGAGTVKNVAFVNVISDNVNRTLANETHGCTFENVFVSSNAKYMLQTSWDSPTFKNVVFISSDSVAGRVFNEGGRGTVTATNVFLVGQKLCYYNGTSNETNVQAFATEDALLTALATENWTDSLFSFADDKLLFAGNPLSYEEENLANPVNLGDLQTAAKKTEIAVPAELGNITGISFNGFGRMSGGVAYSDGVLTLEQSVVKAMANANGYGDISLKLYNDSGKFYTVSAYVITKALASQADLQSIAIDGTLDGYFVLTDDIVCDGTTPIILAGYTSTTTGGFIGTFDGRGHTISNVNVGTQGFFRGIGAGTVKNVAFVNIISDNVNRSLANETHGSTFENVFVSSNAKYMLQTSWDSPTFKNVVFISADGAAGRVFNEGDRGTLTATNVFMVGQKLCYFGGTNNQTNVQAFASTNALLTAISAENWTDSYFTYADGKLLFNGKVVAE